MVTIKILGTIQDGGLPHPGCNCRNCSTVKSFETRRFVASIGILGDEATILVDATPDFVDQAHVLKLLNPHLRLGFDSILITHLHIGHYLGLAHLGKEVADTECFPVFATEKTHRVLRNNIPFSYLYQRKQISQQNLAIGKSIDFGNFTLNTIEVPHRNDNGNTLGIQVLTGDKSFLYIPDIDYLPNWLIPVLEKQDLVIFDGTFYTNSDIDRQDEVPHPPILEVIAQLGPRKSPNFYFTHFNHTNPLLYDQMLELELNNQNFMLAHEGQEFQI